ncbi:MAG: glycosyltransferase, partial [Muribaculaceae bacterium]|nr:glycosyltransferase [Muribaculaceae bacterium]
MDTKYSIIIPVYNRIDEVRDLLTSLEQQTAKNFEVIIVEDGSTERCDHVVEDAKSRGLNVRYFYKENEGRSIARNYGLERADGDYFIFFDSDCVIPPSYFETVDRELSKNHLDCFGGPDAAHDSFSDVQKAINYSMTSFLTTGGIRGGKINLEKFVPRTFNMGFSRKVYDKVGGFREMFSEDIDMSTRIKQAGFSIGLIRQAPVWHKRRIDLRKFLRQVYVFGMSRITLKLLYPDSLKLVHCLPAVFVLGCVALILLAIFVSRWFLLPLAIYFLLVLLGAVISTRSLKIGLLAVPAAAIQLGGYGCGFIKAYF